MKTKTETKKILSALKRAMKRISKPVAWAKGAWGREVNSNGVTIRAWSWMGGRQAARKPEANCWCAVGAVFAATPDDKVADAAIAELRETGYVAVGKYKGCSIVVFNDVPKTTQKDVIAVFKRTIARLEKRVSA